MSSGPGRVRKNTRPGVLKSAILSISNTPGLHHIGHTELDGALGQPRTHDGGKNSYRQSAGHRPTGCAGCPRRLKPRGSRATTLSMNTSGSISRGSVPGSAASGCCCTVSVGCPCRPASPGFPGYHRPRNIRPSVESDSSSCSTTSPLLRGQPALVRAIRTGDFAGASCAPGDRAAAARSGRHAPPPWRRRWVVP